MIAGRIQQRWSASPHGKGRACGIDNPTLICAQYVRRKSGSCSSADTITPASDLVDQDPRFQDFVIAHEPPHLRVPAHGRLFKSLMRSAHVPGWRELEAQSDASRTSRRGHG